MNSSRARPIFSPDEISRLEEAWDGGMTSPREKAKVDEMSAALSGPTQQIKDWIGNRHQKQKISGGGPNAEKRRTTAYDIRPNAYNMFCRGKTIEPSSSRQSFIEWSQEWNGLSDAQKEGYKVKAEAAQTDPGDVLNKRKLKAHYLKLVSLHCEKLGKLGIQIGGLFVDEDNNCPGVFGSDQAYSFFAKREKDTFLGGMIGREGVSNECMMRCKAVQSVRGIFNDCWEKETGQSQQVPYKAIKDGTLTIAMANLPDGITFRNPSNMGTSQLRKIISSKDTLSLRVVSKENSTVHPEPAEIPIVLPTTPDTMEHETPVVLPTTADVQPDMPDPMEHGEVGILADLLDPEIEKPVEESVDPSSRRYDVEKILKSHKRGKGKQVLIKWKGYKKPTWEPEENL